MNATNLAWHYTTGSHLPTIAQSQGLIPTALPVSAGAAKVLWFSRRQQWDPSAAKTEWKRRDMFRHRPQAGLRAQAPLFRFGLPRNDTRLLPWPAITRVAGIDVPEAMVMVTKGLRAGANPTDWLGTMSAIPLADLHFQAWDGKQWQDASLHEHELAARHGDAAAPAASPGVPGVAARRGAAHDLH
ncbi:hypothetical protein AB4Z48_28785 [Cupriavidus sp. 2TAF22]|uniref:hypothetical protein n=1 Tax=unclassified Cupriavidus TaxID=2640874 RepID=UPI003F8E1F94